MALRFTDNLDGTVTDNLTGLIWLQTGRCFDEFAVSWTTALDSVNSLADGSCGLTDGSLPGDWRIPNINELLSLVDWSRVFMSLPLGHPFSNLSGRYWTSTTSHNKAHARDVNLAVAQIETRDKTDDFWVNAWPVRGPE